MHYFYVLYSLKDHRLYKGSSSSVSDRFIKHISGGVPSTKHRRPLILIYSEGFSSKLDALKRERWSKSLEGGIELKQILVGKSILKADSSLNISLAG